MEKSEARLPVKVLLLAFYILLLYSWFSYHFDNEIIKAITGAVLLFAAILSFLMKYQNKAKEDKLKDFLNDWLNALLSLQVIIFLYILLFIVGCFISSIHVGSENPVRNLKVYLLNVRYDTIKDYDLGKSNPLIKRTVLTIPFGRSFLVKAEGYQNHSFRVYPWSGKQISIEKDLQVSPSVLLRIPVKYLPELTRLKLRLRINNYSQIFNINDHGAIIIGQPSEIPENYYSKWQIELRSIVNSDQIINSALNDWWVKEPLFLPANFMAFDSLRVELLSSRDSVYAQCNAIIGPQKLKELNFNTLR